MKYLELYEIIGLEICEEDELIPNSKPHVYYWKDPVSLRRLPMLFMGSSWDLLWWIYRLNEFNGSFDDFLDIYLMNI